MKYGNKREITKEIYDIAMKNNGLIPDDKRVEVFGEALVYGYGVYMPEVYEEDGNYYVKFSCGDSCE